MRPPSYSDAFEVLCLQAADEGRGDVLFGDSLNRARSLAAPFIVGEEFPSVYLEFPLKGDPFLDVTVLYSKIAAGTRIESEAADGSEEVLDWFARSASQEEEVSFGFELDTKQVDLPPAAIHFQPRRQTHLVKPFCIAAGEPDKASLYLQTVQAMPDGWPLSFFGMFRGRAESPLRVCGYLGEEVVRECAQNPRSVKATFDKIGFTAYDDEMLKQISSIMAAAPGMVDFQFDIYPDGISGDVFAIDIQFEIEVPEAVLASFEEGPVSHVMDLLVKWGIVDERWRLVGHAAFARALPVELEEGGMGRYSFALMPQWVKVRWRNGVLQPAKMYLLGSAGLLERDQA